MRNVFFCLFFVSVQVQATDMQLALAYQTNHAPHCSLMYNIHAIEQQAMAVKGCTDTTHHDYKAAAGCSTNNCIPHNSPCRICAVGTARALLDIHPHE